MSLKHGILGLLADQSRTGYEISEYFHTILHQMWFAQQSQVYRELAQLEKEGLATSEIEVQVGRPNKRLYSITSTGRAALSDWIRTFDFQETMKNRDDFALRIFFGEAALETHGPSAIDELKNQLAAFLAENQRLLEKLQELEQELDAGEEHTRGTPGESRPLFWRLSLIRGRKLYQGNIAWAEEALALLERYGH